MYSCVCVGECVCVCVCAMRKAGPLCVAIIKNKVPPPPPPPPTTDRGLLLGPATAYYSGDRPLYYCQTHSAEKYAAISQCQFANIQGASAET